MGGVGGNRFGNFARGVGGDMPPDRCGRYRFSVPVAAECAELFPLPEEARAWEKVRYKSGDVNYNTGHLLYNIGHMFYNIGHMFYKTAHPRYKSSDMFYKIGDMFYKSVDMPRIPLIIAPYATITAPRVKLHPIEEKLTESRTEAHRGCRVVQKSSIVLSLLVEQAIPKAAGVLAACPAGLSRACRVYLTHRNAL